MQAILVVTALLQCVLIAVAQEQCDSDNGWEGPYAGSCYKLVKKAKKNWADANTVGCCEENAQLAIARDQGTLEFLGAKFDFAIDSGRSAWIGGDLVEDSTVGNIKWIDGVFGDVDSGAAPNFWFDGQSDGPEPDGVGDERVDWCVKIKRGGWTDQQCTVKRDYICEKLPGTPPAPTPACGPVPVVEPEVEPPVDPVPVVEPVVEPPVDPVPIVDPVPVVEPVVEPPVDPGLPLAPPRCAWMEPTHGLAHAEGAQCQGAYNDDQHGCLSLCQGQASCFAVDWNHKERPWMNCRCWLHMSVLPDEVMNGNKNVDQYRKVTGPCEDMPPLAGGKQI